MSGWHSLVRDADEARQAASGDCQGLRTTGAGRADVRIGVGLWKQAKALVPGTRSRSLVLFVWRCTCAKYTAICRKESSKRTVCSILRCCCAWRSRLYLVFANRSKPGSSWSSLRDGHSYDQVSHQVRISTPIRYHLSLRHSVCRTR